MLKLHIPKEITVNCKACLLLVANRSKACKSVNTYNYSIAIEYYK